MRFRPSWLSTLVLAALTGVFYMLGAWQNGRATMKEQLQAEFKTAPRLTRLPDSPPAYARVRVTGQFDLERHFLVDNRIHAGQPGVHVLSPFYLAGSGDAVLVNRGWLAMAGDRRSLPSVEPITGPVTISGQLGPIDAGGPKLGEPDRLQTDSWPQLLTYPDQRQLAAALNQPLYPQAIYLAADSPGGFQGRDWQPFSMGPDKHRAYAFQWWALAVTAVAAWGVLGALRSRESTS